MNEILLIFRWSRITVRGHLSLRAAGEFINRDRALDSFIVDEKQANLTCQLLLPSRARAQNRRSRRHQRGMGRTQKTRNENMEERFFALLFQPPKCWFMPLALNVWLNVDPLWKKDIADIDSCSKIFSGLPNVFINWVPLRFLAWRAAADCEERRRKL